MNKLNRINVHNRRCGFFSDFLTALSGLIYSYDGFTDFFIDWRSELYSESDINGAGKYNLFSKYFYQDKNEEDLEYYNVTTLTASHNPYIEYFFPKIYNQLNPKSIYSGLYYPSFLIKELKILESDFFKKINKNYFNDEKILGVHKRGTDHTLHGEIISDVIFLEKINELYKKNNFDKIFLITDDLNSFEFFKKELGNDMIYTDSFKTSSSSGIHLGGNPGKEQIAEEVIKDAFILSQTDFKLITRSNVSTFSLLCDLKQDNFLYIDDHIRYE
jgi:hypothetical protein